VGGFRRKPNSEGVDNEEQGREVYLPERDDGISLDILRGITKRELQIRTSVSFPPLKVGCFFLSVK